MIERLEVSPGPGTVIRFGSVVAWTSASASASLVSFLTESARNLAESPVSGDQLADHLAGVLHRRDPEPHVPFVVIGPSEDGWAALLHGPVQVWDGVAWTAANPHPGWMRASLWPRPGLSVSVSGAPVPSPSPDSTLDLVTGVVPGGGFLLLPAVPAPGGGALPLLLTTPVTPEEETAVLDLSPATADPGLVAVTTLAATVGSEADQSSSADETSDEEPPDHQASDDRATDAEAATDTGRDAGTAAVDEAQPGTGSEAETESATEPEPGAEVGPGGPPAPPGVVDLRNPLVRQRVVAYPPLPPGGDPPRAVPGAPVVAGVPCPRGHLNRPGLPTCVRCGKPVGTDGGYQVSGTRPALGCLITDRGDVYGLDSGYLIGSNPSRDATVRGRLARPLVLSGDDVAASHAEIRLHDWDVVVTDRASEGGTHIYPPGAAEWERLRPYDPRVLRPGTHLAFGQRVLTFVTPWNVTDAGDPADAPGSTDQDTSARY
jgi:hypothetical protein